MEACFSGPAIALLGVVAAAIQATIIALFVALMRAKDAHIVREQKLNGEQEERIQQLLAMLLPATRGLEQATAALREKRRS